MVIGWCFSAPAKSSLGTRLRSACSLPYGSRAPARVGYPHQTRSSFGVLRRKPRTNRDFGIHGWDKWDGWPRKGTRPFSTLSTFSTFSQQFHNPLLFFTYTFHIPLPWVPFFVIPAHCAARTVAAASNTPSWRPPLSWAIRRSIRDHGESVPPASCWRSTLLSKGGLPAAESTFRTGCGRICRSRNSCPSS